MPRKLSTNWTSREDEVLSCFPRHFCAVQILPGMQLELILWHEIQSQNIADMPSLNRTAMKHADPHKLVRSRPAPLPCSVCGPRQHFLVPDPARSSPLLR